MKPSKLATEKEMRQYINKLESELEWLSYFYRKADFGPAHEDVVDWIEQSYKEETGKDLPDGYSC